MILALVRAGWLGTCMAEPQCVGFLGLGALGAAMAGNLLERGYALRVFNRTAAKAAPLVARGAHRAESPRDAAERGGIVVSVLWDDAAADAVATSEGFLDALGPGGVHVAMGTIRPATAQRLAALHASRGVDYVDAPVFGRPEAATARQLWIPIAGPAAAKQRARPVLDALGARGVFDFGEAAGAAVLVKLVGNYMIGSASRTMAEALAIAAASGGDAHAIVEMLTTTLFPAPIYQSYGKRLADGEPPMRGGIPEKDVGLVLDLARERGVPAPLAAALYDVVKT